MSREESHFHNDSALGGFREKIAIAREKFGVPFFQIEFVSAACIAGSVAARPRSQESARLGSQIVMQNSKRFRGDFHIGAGEETRIVQAVGFQSGEIAVIVKVAVQHRSVVLAAGYQGNSLSAEEEVVRIRGMKTDGL